MMDSLNKAAKICKEHKMGITDCIVMLDKPPSRRWVITMIRCCTKMIAMRDTMMKITQDATAQKATLNLCSTGARGRAINTLPRQD